MYWVCAFRSGITREKSSVTSSYFSSSKYTYIYNIKFTNKMNIRKTHLNLHLYFCRYIGMYCSVLYIYSYKHTSNLKGQCTVKAKMAETKLHWYIILKAFFAMCTYWQKVKLRTFHSLKPPDWLQDTAVQWHNIGSQIMWPFATEFTHSIMQQYSIVNFWRVPCQGDVSVLHRHCKILHWSRHWRIKIEAQTSRLAVGDWCQLSMHWEVLRGYDMFRKVIAICRVTAY